MAAAYRSSTSNTTSSTPASSLVLTLPSGVQVGDYLIATINVAGGSGATITAPSGWTTLAGPTNESTNEQLLTQYRIATGLEASTYTWTFDTTRQAAGAMAAYSGCYPYSAPAGGVSSSVASGTLAQAGMPAANSGIFIDIWGTANTTASNSLSGTAYTQDQNVCTTASPFISITLQHGTHQPYPPQSSNASGTQTCSQSSTYITQGIFLADATITNPNGFGLWEEYTANSGFSSASTETSNAVGLFKVEQPHTTVLAFIGLGSDAQTVTSITGSGLTWVNVARANTQTGSAEIWRTVANATAGSLGITINFSGAVHDYHGFVVGIQGTDPSGTNGSGAIGATNIGSYTTSAPTLSLTTTRNNSLVYGIITANNGSTTVTADTGQSKLFSSGDTTNNCAITLLRQTAVTPALGTSVTIDGTAPTTLTGNIAMVEILPAISHGLASSGAGS